MDEHWYTRADIKRVERRKAVKRRICFLLCFAFFASVIGIGAYADNRDTIVYVTLRNITKKVVVRLKTVVYLPLHWRKRLMSVIMLVRSVNRRKLTSPLMGGRKSECSQVRLIMGFQRG